jgi:hypothetical protein
MQSRSKHLFFALAIAALSSVSLASAAVMGSFKTDGDGTDLTITLTSITFAAPPNLRVTSSTLTYDSGTPLVAGTLGTFSDASSLPVDPFMTFQGTPLDFTLLGFVPGDTTDPNDCSGAVTNGASCSILLAPGFVSPVVLTFLGGQTIASLGLFGTVTDGSGVTSDWTGSLSTTLNGDLSQYTSNPNASGAATPVNIAAYFMQNPGGAFTSSNSGTFSAAIISPTPEPSTWALMFGGLLVGAGVVSRRKRSARA